MKRQWRDGLYRCDITQRLLKLRINTTRQKQQSNTKQQCKEIFDKIIFQTIDVWLILVKKLIHLVSLPSRIVARKLAIVHDNTIVVEQTKKSKNLKLTLKAKNGQIIKKMIHPRDIAVFQKWIVYGENGKSILHQNFLFQIRSKSIKVLFEKSESIQIDSKHTFRQNRI